MNMNLDEEGKKITGDFQELRLLIYNSDKAKIRSTDILWIHRTALRSRFQ